MPILLSFLDAIANRFDEIDPTSDTLGEHECRYHNNRKISTITNTLYKISVGTLIVGLFLPAIILLFLIMYECQ